MCFIVFYFILNKNKFALNWYVLTSRSNIIFHLSWGYLSIFLITIFIHISSIPTQFAYFAYSFQHSYTGYLPFHLCMRENKFLLIWDMKHLVIKCLKRCVFGNHAISHRKANAYKHKENTLEWRIYIAYMPPKYDKRTFFVAVLY